MVSNLTYNNKKYIKFKEFHINSSIISQKYKSIFLEAVNDDTVAYNKIINARRLPKKNTTEIEYRNNEILQATLNATDIPFKILQTCTQAIKETYNVSKKGNINSISDIGVAAHMIYAASKGAYYNILINLFDLPEKYRKSYLEKSDYYLKQIDDSHHKILSYVQEILIK